MIVLYHISNRYISMKYSPNRRAWILEIHPEALLMLVHHEHHAQCHVSRVTAAFRRRLAAWMIHYAITINFRGRMQGGLKGVAGGMKSRAGWRGCGSRQCRSISPGDGDSIGNCR